MNRSDWDLCVRYMCSKSEWIQLIICYCLGPVQFWTPMSLVLIDSFSRTPFVTEIQNGRHGWRRNVWQDQSFEQRSCDIQTAFRKILWDSAVTHNFVCSILLSEQYYLYFLIIIHFFNRSIRFGINNLPLEDYIFYSFHFKGSS